jgi:hypothetical protein
MLPMLIGNARVSTLGQSLELQTDALKRAGCEKPSRTQEPARACMRSLGSGAHHGVPGKSDGAKKVDEIALDRVVNG